MKKKIVVTGGAGFIGSAVVAALNKIGRNEIFIIDNLGKSDKWKNLIGLHYEDYFEKNNFLDTIGNEPQFLQENNVEAVIHMGACSSTTQEDADYLMYNNTYYSKALCMNALENNCRFIYASSAATYGLGEQGYQDGTEKLSSYKPLNRYGYSKHLFDLWADREKLFDKITGLKFFNVFGPNEYHKADMQSMIRKAFFQIQDPAQGSVKLFKCHNGKYADGDQMRDFIYIKDVVDVVLWLLENPTTNGLFNLGTGKARSWNDLMKAVFAAVGKEPRIEYIEMPEKLKSQYQDFTEADMTTLASVGYKKEFKSLEDTVGEYVRTYLLKGEFLTGDNY